MSTSRSSTLLVAVVFMTAVMFTWTPDVDAGADKYWKVKKVWKYVVSSTGEWCYTVTQEWPPYPDTNTEHYQDYHAGDEVNTHTHGYYITTIEHVYTVYVSSCPG